MKKIFCLAVVVMCSVGLIAGTVQSQEDNQGYTYGRIMTLSANTIVIKEIDYDTEQEVELSFVINGETGFENVTSVNDLRNGDEVEITFKEIGGQKIAVLITKEESWPLPDDELWIDSEEDSTRG